MGSNGTQSTIEDGRYSAAQNVLGEFTRPRAWRVIHACENARDVLPVVEGQVAAGMRPYIVTPQGEGSAEFYLAGRGEHQALPLSLLRSWQDVRNWRKSILGCDPASSADIVHAHSFAAGMAAVRSIGGVVYDLDGCIEELAIAAGQCEPGSWMGRSFRVAEQFVLARAAAVIVHSTGMKAAAQERGAPAEGIFLIPDPLPQDDDFLINMLGSSENFLRQRLGLKQDAVTFLVPGLAGADRTELRPEDIVVLESFSLAFVENPDFVLLLEGEVAPALRSRIADCASRLKIRDRVLIVEAEDSALAWQMADVVIAGGDLPHDPVSARHSNELCLRALYSGKALLAAAIPRNRDVSPEGRGCLWFEPGNARDCAARVAFLGRNPGFRAALGTTGRAYLLETRNCSAIGKQYREAYRYAFGRKRFTGPGTGMASLQPAANWS
ncbi:MAG TPA: glycosyltransferase [Candidatus Acidoferrales bacterium]|jgi:glycosyltransferase involved in cell wall biosynthesis|nr:glycosyltransferase [Candidatus Acidoferrales bacterium]